MEKNVLFVEEDFRKDDFSDVELFLPNDVAKQALKTLRVDLSWVPLNEKGEDLDVCAFMLNKEGKLTCKEDLVYFNSKRRWMTDKEFNDPEFDPLEGKVSLWEDEKVAFRGRVRAWLDRTLPLSLDDAVIGSWDDMADDGDDENTEYGETLHVKIEDIDTTRYQRIVVAAALAEDKVATGGTFSDVTNAVVSVSDAEKPEGTKPLVSYKLASQFPGKCTVCFAELVYDEDNFIWQIKPMSDSYQDGIMGVANYIFH